MGVKEKERLRLQQEGERQQPRRAPIKEGEVRRFTQLDDGMMEGGEKLLCSISLCAGEGKAPMSLPSVVGDGEYPSPSIVRVT